MSVGAVFLEWLGWLFEASASLAPWIATIGALFLLLRVLQKKWRWAAFWSVISLVFGFLWFVGIADALPWRDDGRPALRVVTANLLAINAEPEAVYEWAGGLDADLLAFQEVTRSIDGHLQPLNQTYIATTESYGLRVFSRYPIVNQRTVTLAQGGRDVLRFDLRTQEGLIAVVVAHLVSPGTAEDLAIRNRQLGALAQLMRSIDGDVVLLGDLNTAVTTPAFAGLLRSGDLRHPQVPPFFATWPSQLPVGLFQIDHVLVGGDLAYARVGTRDIPGSDHRAVYAELVRPPQ